MNEQELTDKINKLEQRKNDILNEVLALTKQQDKLSHEWDALCLELKKYNRRLHLLQTQKPKVRGYGLKWGHKNDDPVYN